MKLMRFASLVLIFVLLSYSCNDNDDHFYTVEWIDGSGQIRPITYYDVDDHCAESRLLPMQSFIIRLPAPYNCDSYMANMDMMAGTR